jgi:hypothetical protein
MYVYEYEKTTTLAACEMRISYTLLGFCCGIAVGIAIWIYNLGHDQVGSPGNIHMIIIPSVIGMLIGRIVSKKR